jgi:hypothetical protein
LLRRSAPPPGRSASGRTLAEPPQTGNAIAPAAQAVVLRSVSANGAQRGATVGAR